MTTPGDASAWVVAHVGLIPANGVVLDLACGGGRHARFLRARGHKVVAVDRDLSRVIDLRDDSGVELIETDLEDGRALPFLEGDYAGVVVTNYLHRPLLPALVAAVATAGALIYETFAVGNERFGRPSQPEFLLRRGELLAVVGDRLRVVDYEDVVVDDPKPAAIQHIAAVRDAG